MRPACPSAVAERASPFDASLQRPLRQAGSTALRQAGGLRSALHCASALGRPWIIRQVHGQQSGGLAERSRRKAWSPTSRGSSQCPSSRRPAPKRAITPRHPCVIAFHLQPFTFPLRQLVLLPFPRRQDRASVLAAKEPAEQQPVPAHPAVDDFREKNDARNPQE